jgi:thioredoxin 1
MPGVVSTFPGMSQLPTLDLPAFEALAALPGITAIDFTAAWCAPCKTMEPVLAALATEYKGRVRLAAIDVNNEPILAERYGVRSMPTLVVLRDGREVGRVVGSRPRAFVAGVLDRALSGDVAIASP